MGFDKSLETTHEFGVFAKFKNQWFSTLRRVKTRLQSTMSDERLPDLYMASVHCEKINKGKQVLLKWFLIALDEIPDVCSSCFLSKIKS